MNWTWKCCWCGRFNAMRYPHCHRCFTPYAFNRHFGGKAMSGGSLEYVYQKVEDAASNILSRSEKPEHRAFARHLLKVAKALHDLEWVFSCDYGSGDETKAIMQCVTHADIVSEAAERVVLAKADFDAALVAYYAKGSEQGTKP